MEEWRWLPNAISTSNGRMKMGKKECGDESDDGSCILNVLGVAYRAGKAWLQHVRTEEAAHHEWRRLGGHHVGI